MNNGHDIAAISPKTIKTSITNRLAEGESGAEAFNYKFKLIVCASQLCLILY